MKKIFYFILITQLISCTENDPTKIHVEDLKNPCDFVDAVYKIKKEWLSLCEDKPGHWVRKKDLSFDDNLRIDKLKELRKKIDKRLKIVIKEYTRTQRFKDPENYDPYKFEREMENCNGNEFIETITKTKCL